MAIKPLGFWRRFLAVFTPSFLLRLEQTKSTGKSWGFWFLSIFLLLLIPTIGVGIGGSILLSHFPDNALNAIPANTTFELPDGTTHDVKTIISDFEVTLDENFELTTKNIPDPMILVVSEEENDDESEETTFVSSFEEIDETTADMVFVLDTKERFVTLEDSENFENAIFVLHDKFIAKTEENGKTEIISFQDIFSKAQEEGEKFTLPYTLNIDSFSELKEVLSGIFFVLIAIVFGIAYLFLAGFRLISVLFWTLIFWAIGAIAKVKEWNFEKSFMAMLHFSFVTLLLFPLGVMLGLSMFLSTFILLALLFGMNFYTLKKKA